MSQIASLSNAVEKPSRRTASVSNRRRARGRIRARRLSKRVHPPRRQAHGEAAALRWCAVDKQLRLVAHEHMLDDGEPQSGAAGRARSASVDTIEALGQTRNVLVGDAD